MASVGEGEGGVWARASRHAAAASVCPVPAASHTRGPRGARCLGA